MVEYKEELDAIFGSLADGTRRDILKRVSKSDLSVSEIAAPYSLTLAAISKHVQVLERAKLVHKKRHGRQFMISLSPAAFAPVSAYFTYYEQLWNNRFDRLEKHLMNPG